MNAEELTDAGDEEARKGNFKKAYELYLKSSNKDANAMYPKIKMAQALRKMDKDVSAILALVSIGNVKNIHVYNELAICLCNIGELDEAEAMYKKSLEIDPKNIDALGGIIKNYVMQGDSTSALKYLNVACDIKGADKDFFLLRGRIHSRLGNSQEAIPDLQLSSKTTDDPFVFFDLGYEFFIIKEYEESMRMFDKQLEKHPQDTKTMTYKGACYQHLGDNHAALAMFEQACSIDIVDIKIVLLKAMTLMSLGRIDEAHACADNILKRQPNNKSALTTKGKIFNEERQYQKALACFNAVLMQDPEHSSAFSNKSLSLLKLGDNKAALKCIDESIKYSDEPYVEALLAKAFIYDVLGDKQGERGTYIDILKIEPYNQIALDKLDEMR